MIWTALIIGLVGSLHCIGMCSPLAIAVSNMTPKLIINRLFYHSGRLLLYGLLGALVASVGFSFQISNYQNLLSIVIGLALIAAAATNHFTLTNKLFNKLNVQLKVYFSGLLKNKNHFSVFLLGMLNGFLPCGLIYVALSYCMISPTIGEGFVFMLLFGLGTLPALVGFASFFHWITKRLYFKPQVLMASLQMLSGVILIARVFFIHIPHTTHLIDIVTCGI